MLVPRLQDFVLATIYEGIEEAATENGYSTFVTNSLDDPANKALRTEMMLQRRGGIIFGDAHHDDPLLADIAARGIPFVLVSRRQRRLHVGDLRRSAGGAAGRSRLLEAGRRDPRRPCRPAIRVDRHRAHQGCG